MKSLNYSGEAQIEDAKGQIRNIRIWGHPEAKNVDSGFTKWFDVFTESIMLNTDITGKAIRLFFLISKAQKYDNYEVYLDYPTVKEKLKVSEPTYRRWLSALIKAGLIKRIKTNLYTIGEYTVVKGCAYKKGFKPTIVKKEETNKPEGGDKK